MNHAELVEKVAHATGMPKAAASGAAEALVQTIVDAAMAGEEVRVTGLHRKQSKKRDYGPVMGCAMGNSSAINRAGFAGGSEP